MSVRARLPVVVLAAAVLAAGATLLVVALRPASPPRSMQAQVRSVAVTLRCPVCQDLSVADSPSAIARDMRAEIAADLRAGMSPDRIRAIFVSRYGDWILLSPPRSGVSVVVWLAPILLLLGGAAVAAVALRRWIISPGPGRSHLDGTAPMTVGDRGLLERALAAEDVDVE